MKFPSRIIQNSSLPLFAAALVFSTGCGPAPKDSNDKPETPESTPPQFIEVATPEATPELPPKPESLGISTQPLQSIAGRLFDPAPAARVTDSTGRFVSGVAVTVALSKNTFTSSSGLQSLTDAEGVAVFDNLSVEKAESGYFLSFSAEGCPPVESAEFNVRFAPARAMSIAVQPGASRAGKPVDGPPTVRVVDSFGNPVPRVPVEVRLQQPANGILGGATRAITGENGEAVFTTVSLKGPAREAVLVFDAKAAGVANVASEPFRVR